MIRSSLLTLLLFVCAVAASAASSVTMEVTRTSPSSGFVLPRDGTIYMEVTYRADQPLRLQARAFKDGKSLDAGQRMNASAVHPAGTGKALVWVSYGEAAVIDEVRLTAYDEGWQPLLTLAVARPAQWLAKSAQKRADPPEWVHGLIAAEQRIAEQYRKDHPPQPDPWGDAMIAFMFLAVPGYFVLQAAAVFTQRGRWRWAALAPLLITAPAALHAMLALSAGSNLWPIVFIFAAPLGFLYLALLFAFRLVPAVLHCLPDPKKKTGEAFAPPVCLTRPSVVPVSERSPSEGRGRHCHYRFPPSSAEARRASERNSDR